MRDLTHDASVKSNVLDRDVSKGLGRSKQGVILPIGEDFDANALAFI
tara:strand:- start:773 stop:913 length:141 start_codon:yes stop_codon:yes gene_type:complete